jgi:hypothetical protein
VVAENETALVQRIGYNDVSGFFVCLCSARLLSEAYRLLPSLEAGNSLGTIKLCRQLIHAQITSHMYISNAIC